MAQRNEYLDQGLSDVSDAESGYDSEAAEVSRTERRGVKRRKLSHSSASSVEEDGQESSPVRDEIAAAEAKQQHGEVSKEIDIDEDDAQVTPIDYRVKSGKDQGKRPKKQKKETTPGVVYLSSLPPYLKPSALRNLLAQRSFEPITRLFLTPASKHKHNSKKSSRQLYTEGWIEFASKKTAKRCAEALNAQLIGGKKGGFYYDDLWNMKYLKGMAWDELMAGIVEERREAEGRRDEERRKIAAETQAFVEGVEQGKKLEGMRKKRKMKAQDPEDGADNQRTWRQHEVAGDRKAKKNPKTFDPEVQQVLSKIF